MLADKDSQRIFTVERQRTERSQRPFILLLLDMGDDPPSKVNREILGKVLSVLSASTRDSDVIGWWNNSVLGVMFTEFGCDDFNTLQSTLTTRLSDTLRENLSEQQFNQCASPFIYSRKNGILIFTRRLPIPMRLSAVR